MKEKYIIIGLIGIVVIVLGYTIISSNFKNYKTNSETNDSEDYTYVEELDDLSGFDEEDVFNTESIDYTINSTEIEETTTEDSDNTFEEDLTGDDMIDIEAESIENDDNQSVESSNTNSDKLDYIKNLTYDDARSFYLSKHPELKDATVVVSSDEMLSIGHFFILKIKEPEYDEYYSQVTYVIEDDAWEETDLDPENFREEN